MMDGDDEKWTWVVWAMALWAWESDVESVGFGWGIHRVRPGAGQGQH